MLIVINMPAVGLFFLVVVAMIFIKLLLEKKYMLIVLIYIEIVFLLCFYVFIYMVLVFEFNIYNSLFIILISAAMAALGLVFITVCVRHGLSNLVTNWFIV